MKYGECNGSKAALWQMLQKVENAMEVEQLYGTCMWRKK